MTGTEKFDMPGSFKFAPSICPNHIPIKDLKPTIATGAKKKLVSAA
jgi:hypothetical protein